MSRAEAQQPAQLFISYLKGWGPSSWHLVTLNTAPGVVRPEVGCELTPNYQILIIFLSFLMSLKTAQKVV